MDYVENEFLDRLEKSRTDRKTDGKDTDMSVDGIKHNPRKIGRSEKH
jgi:hypothetical protein